MVDQANFNINSDGLQLRSMTETIHYEQFLSFEDAYDYALSRGWGISNNDLRFHVSYDDVNNPHTIKYWIIHKA